MIQRIVTLAAWFIAGVLIIFTVRRWLFTLLALLPDNPPSPPTPTRPDLPVLLLAPIRNEAPILPEFLAHLAALAYPEGQLVIVLINDGSTDGTEPLLQQWAQERSNRHVLSLSQNVGKAQALNMALAQFPQGEVVAIYDADERPRPDALAILAAPFRDSQVGGVSGRRAVSNALASPAASYTTFEGLVHQVITMRAKDRLNLAPAILGANCAYRRTALAQVGNFQAGALLEDSDLTLKLAGAGWNIRFVAPALSYHTVPESVTGYWRQHTRWARGFNEVAKQQAGSTLANPHLPWLLRLELLVFAAGYLDRLALLAGVVLAGLDRRVRVWLGRVIGLSLLTPFLQMMAALLIEGAPFKLWLQLIWLPAFFGLDIAMAVSGMGATLKQAPQIWEERRTRH